MKRTRFPWPVMTRGWRWAKLLHDGPAQDIMAAAMLAKVLSESADLPGALKKDTEHISHLLAKASADLASINRLMGRH